MPGSYKYDPLFFTKKSIQGEETSSQDEIRLVELHPGSWEDEICCEIKHVSFAEAWRLQFDALSYVWGSGEERTSILTPQGEFEVTPNLWSALRRLRRTHYYRYVWVDALCIDQSNIAERNHQVGRMSDIYSSANRVIVWLGEHDGPAPFLCLWRLKSELVCNRVISPENSKEVMDLFSKEWFHRKWVIQEAALGRFVFAWCGAYTCDWSLLDAILDELYHDSDNFFQPREVLYQVRGGEFTMKAATGLNHALLMSLLREQHGPWHTLSSLLMSTMAFNCSDQRDHIYAITSLVRTVEFKRSGSAALAPDYSLTVEETLLRAIRWCFQHEGYYLLKHVSSNLLNGLCRYSKKNGLPSWAGLSRSHLYQDQENQEEQDFFVSLSHACESSFSRLSTLTHLAAPVFDDEGVLMQVEGEVLDTVKSLDFRFDGGNESLAYYKSATMILAGPSDYWAKWGRGAVRYSTALPGRKFPKARYSIEVFARSLEQERREEAVLTRSLPPDLKLPSFPESEAILKPYLKTKVLCLTEERLIALVPPNAQPGDRIVALRGSLSPFVLRACGSGHWNLIGEAHMPALGLGSSIHRQYNPALMNEQFVLC